MSEHRSEAEASSDRQFPPGGPPDDGAPMSQTTPDVPLRMELAFELPGTPEQVWHAIATSEGITSWFIPTDVEEREGGAVVTHMGPDAESPGTITGWDPPRRFAYEEPDWASLTGRAGAPVTPLATEFLVEARSGGTCVVRVVSSAFGTGAEWEREFFHEMERGWRPFFDHLRLYLANFPGQSATRLSVATEMPGPPGPWTDAMRRALGVTDVGGTVDARGLTARVEAVNDVEVLLHVTGRVPGYIGFYAYDKGDGSSVAQVAGYLFSEDAAAFVAREEPGWKAWLETVAVRA